MPAEESSSSSVWSREEDKRFERAIADYPEDCSDRWEKIAGKLPGKSLEEIKHHYEVLIDDVDRIESGFIQVPCYNDSSSDGLNGRGGGGGDETSGGKRGGQLNGDSNHGGGSSRPSKSDQERRKGIAWTEDEHRLFLLGLDKYGKGDWRSISRNFVVTRTPTQVASHAQKYFIRLNSMNKERRRSSIHDITNINGGGDAPAPQAPITGSTPSHNPSDHNQTPAGLYRPAQPTIGQPIHGHIVSAVGTPVQHLGGVRREPPAGAAQDRRQEVNRML